MAITEFFHLIHIVDEEDEVDTWYDAVFAPQRFAPKHWMEVEKRWASLSMIGNFMIEVIEPSGEPEHLGFPLSKFRTRFGQHFHSLAWYTDEGGIKPLFDRLRAMGVRVAKPGGGVWPEGDVDPGPTIFTHPKDTFGQFEFVDVVNWKDKDPRFAARLGSDLASRPTSLGYPPGVPFHHDRGRPAKGDRPVRTSPPRAVVQKASTPDRDSVFVVVGSETVVELAQPTSPTGRLADDLASNGELPHACTFTVRDLDAVERHLADVGVRVAERAGDTLTLNPADCFNALYRFTTTAIPGDPRTS